MNKKIRLLGALFVSLSLITGCANDETSDETSNAISGIASKGPINGATEI